MNTDKGKGSSTAAIEKISEFRRFGSILGLERMQILMKKLGDPQKDLKYIHVAGTNGKGSVCRFLYSALLANGYNVGLFTSPYLTVFNERIEYNGNCIEDGEIEVLTGNVLEKVQEMIDEGYEHPTEFEVITALAFLYFKKKKCDIVILEVGLGGRGDSTNIIERPLMSIITSISYDHMDRLGNTLSEIACEKAGIIKENTPVVSNVDDREAAVAIARRAYQKNAVLYDASRIKYAAIKRDMHGSEFSASIYGTPYDNVPISMIGAHQIKNAVTALTALEVLRRKGDIRLERKKLYEGMKKASNIGRFEILTYEKPYIVLDGAHNEAGAAALSKTVKEIFPGMKVLFVTGVLKDKDVDHILDSFCSAASYFIATEPVSERKLTADELAEKIRLRGYDCVSKSRFKEALEYAISECRTGRYKDCDVIVFAGSLYLIGKVRGVLNGIQR